MEICKKEKCTGCFACVNVCSTKCISMSEDEYGELHPVIDENKCLGCMACVKTCPNNIDMTYRYPIKCYASWITNDAKRKECASGGIGTIMSEYVIKHRDGMVYGTQYNSQMEAHTVGGNTDEDIERFKGSKYVQSVVGETFSEIKKNLKDGMFVLYIATPCQIAGLKSFLRRDYDNLVTVDLICHGVCPSSYLTQELAFLKSKHKFNKVTNIRFRGNDDCDFFLSIWNGGKRLFRRIGLYDYYLAGFLWGVSLRENCYSCNYARPERISDITIGDFIGLGKKNKFPYKVSNVSSVTVNTSKGQAFYEQMSMKMEELISVERSYTERLQYAPSLRKPFDKAPERDAFRENVKELGFGKAIRKTLRYRVLPIKIRWQLKRYFYYAPKKLYRILSSRFT